VTESRPRPVGGTILGRTRVRSGEAAEPLIATDEGRAVEATFEELASVPIDDPADGTATATAGGGASAAGRPGTRGTRPHWWLVACVVLALAALVFAVAALQQRSALHADQDQTNELRDVSGRTIAALTSYDYQHLDQWKASVLADATGSFQNQFSSGFSGFQQTYVAEHNRGTGTVEGVWVGPVAAGKATTVVLVQIAVTSLTGTHSLEPYVQVTLLKVAGRWRVDDVQATFDTSGGAGSGTTTPTAPADSPPTSSP
jgi:hypothetical protein